MSIEAATTSATRPTGARDHVAPRFHPPEAEHPVHRLAEPARFAGERGVHLVALGLLDAPLLEQLGEHAHRRDGRAQLVRDSAHEVGAEGARAARGAHAREEERRQAEGDPHGEDGRRAQDGAAPRGEPRDGAPIERRHGDHQIPAESRARRELERPYDLGRRRLARRHDADLVPERAERRRSPARRERRRERAALHDEPREAPVRERSQRPERAAPLPRDEPRRVGRGCAQGRRGGLGAQDGEQLGAPRACEGERARDALADGPGQHGRGLDLEAAGVALGGGELGRVPLEPGRDALRAIDGRPARAR